MNLFLDTNIILDILLKRKGYEDNIKILNITITNSNIKTFLAFHSLSIIFYVAEKKGIKTNSIRESFLSLCDFIKIVACSHDFIYQNILNNENLKDVEDALQIGCALSCKADYIITRNIKDFLNSKIKAISPEDFIKTHHNIFISVK